MAIRYLSAGELQRLRYELGANVVGIGAEPYIEHQRIFDVIQQNLTSDSTEPTTSTTAVTSAGSVTLTLASASGLSAGARVVLDTDDDYEVVTVKALSGSTITVNCRRTHGAPFPVEIESGLTMVRCKLWQLAGLERQVTDAAADAGLKKVDEVEFAVGRESSLVTLKKQQHAARVELASLVNLGQVLRSLGFARGGGLALY